MDPVAWTQTQVRELEEKLARLEAQRQQIVNQIGHLRAWLELYASSGRDEAEKVAQAGAAQPALEDQTRLQGTIADACAVVLRELGRAESTGRLAEMLIERGRLKGVNRQAAYATVYSAMHRQPLRFKKVGRGLWALTNQLLPRPPEVSPGAATHLAVGLTSPG